MDLSGRMSRDSGPGAGGSLLACLVLTLAFVPASAPPGVLEVKSQWRWPGREVTGEPMLAADQVNVTAVVGHTVTLPCRVSNLRDRTVSWIRSRDLTVLAVDRHTVTSDPRFSVVHPEETEDWLLELRGVRAGDQGVYDCQVNTHPKISTKIYLKVLQHQDQASILDIPVSDTGVVSPPAAAPASEEESVLRVRVLGERWVRVAAGWTLRLVCRATGKALHDLHDYSILHNDPLISWTLDGVPVTSLWQQNKVLVRESWSSDMVESEMEVRRLHPSDGGAYACVVPYTNPDRVTVSVTTPKAVGNPSKLASSDEGRGPAPPSSGGSSFGGEQEAAEAAVAGAAAGRAAVISGAIILALLLIQMALCVFYIKKV